MKALRPGTLAFAILALSASGSGAARAGESADLVAARAAFNEGAALAQQKRWSAACDRYTQSLKLHRAALTLYSLAVAQLESGKLVAARGSFQAFLAEPATRSTQPYQEPARNAISDLRMRIGTLTVVLAPAPVMMANVTVDGVTVTSSPVVREAVDPGPHDIVARAPGRAEATARLTVPEGGAVSVTLTLTPLPVGGAASSSASAGEKLTDPEASKQKGDPWPRPLPFALLGTGAAAIGGGVALGLVGFADAKKAPSPTGPAADEARTKAVAGDIMAGCGIAAAGVGLVLLLVQQRQPAVSTGVRAEGAGLSVRF